MYRINVNRKKSVPERNLIFSVLQKLGGKASVDGIFDFLDESVSKDVINAILFSHNQSMVKQEKWSGKHLFSIIWEYIGPKQAFNFQRKRKRK
ncbi:MAG: hypothetical protein WAV11_03730 [Minisyncoccia bacterium]